MLPPDTAHASRMELKPQAFVVAFWCCSIQCSLRSFLALYCLAAVMIVKNIRKYLLATLFNAPSTMDGYYQAEVNHDMPQYAAAR